MSNCYWNHFKTVIRHKWYVFKLMSKAGRPIQGLMHDMSKFGLIEFCSSARYWNGTSSPIDKEKEELGYSMAWQHHKGHNPHHPEYWIDNVMKPGEEPQALLMPKEYAIEMVCDWIGAGMAYEKEKWTYDRPIEWFKNIGSKRRIHPAILMFAEDVFLTIRREQSLDVINKRSLDFLYTYNLNRYEKEVE